MLGSGAIIVVDDSVPVLDVALKTAKFYRHESCGKCTPCREGTNWTVKMLERIERGEATPMDLDIMSSIQDQIMGNCLCVLGDAMAMPISSMIKHFRAGVRGAPRAHAVSPRPRPSSRAARTPVRTTRSSPWAPRRRTSDDGAAPLMPRPVVKMVTFSIDGREVTAPENVMLVDGAKYGDVEIPVFCYEPKLGAPVGACRMCLVEIEGIPKLQTACSTPVKDGMVVHTQTDRVHEAQRAVVEFLLINHPLDCPVCDKGGECPLQDISYGWGGGTSRFIEPKRHFRKPLELSPLIAIDRERCILCYRCVRFSQEIAEDYQLVLQERGAHAFVSTFDGRPYVAPFSGNITELCPVGALTSELVPLPRAPVGHRGLRLDLHAVPVAVQRHADRARRPRHARARTRQPRGRRRLAVRQGPLRVPVHARRRAHHAADGPRGRPAACRRRGRRRWPPRRPRSRRPAARRPRSPAGRPPTRRPSSCSGCSATGWVRPPGLHAGRRPARRIARALAAPSLQATVSDLEFAHTVLLLDADPIDDATIWDLRIRKGVRRRGVELASRPRGRPRWTPTPHAIVRHAPRALEGLLVGAGRRALGRRGQPVRRRDGGRHQRRRRPRPGRRA